LDDLLLAVDDKRDLVALYFALEPDQLVDLEVAAATAIEWARGMKAAAAAMDPNYAYRVSFVVAEPGSSKWFARLERTRQAIEASALNQAAERVLRGWKSVPLLLRTVAALAIVVPTTAKPTYEYWFAGESFSDEQIKQIGEVMRKVQQEPTVRVQRQRVYQTAQRDRHITGLGAGIASSPEWKPKHVVRSDQFVIEDGLFELQVPDAHERTIYQNLDVVLVTPRLQNAPLSWEFRQEGIPGSFRAQMKDKDFLAALDREGVRETLRSNIPMAIQLEIKQRLVEGEWKVARRGRSVVKVLSPRVG